MRTFYVHTVKLDYIVWFDGDVADFLEYAKKKFGHIISWSEIIPISGEYVEV